MSTRPGSPTPVAAPRPTSTARRLARERRRREAQMASWARALLVDASARAGTPRAA